MKNYSIIVPAFNEEKRISKVLSSLKKSFPEQEIIVVDDGSTDKTSEIALRHKCVLIKLKKNSGKGIAVKKGFLKAKGKVIGFVDCDNSVSVKDIKKVFSSVGKTDFAFASRRHPESKIILKQTFSRRLMSRFFNFLVKIFTGLPYPDTQCGCKAMKNKVAKKIAGKMKINGFAFDVEMLSIASKLNYKMEEIPITWKDEKGSSFNLKYIPEMFFSLIKIRENL